MRKERRGFEGGFKKLLMDANGKLYAPAQTKDSSGNLEV